MSSHSLKMYLHFSFEISEISTSLALDLREVILCVVFYTHTHTEFVLKQAFVR